ncbi:MAG: hypothetical protein DLM67_26075 [Candidatus Nephthysia bennettiae]|nr:MAG: hypothetical protein DLM67_26075 [Candidatus Dormibacteraeota bacterium]
MRRVTTRTGSTSSDDSTAQIQVSVSGHFLKVARESVGLSQERFAERLSVDANTIQSWETGRRPIKSIQLSTLGRLKHALRQLGANQQVLTALHDATETDYLLDYILNTNPEQMAPVSHPLATLVMKRSIMDVLAWSLADHVPAWLSTLHRAPRRGPVADTPLLSAANKRRFFEHLRIAADRSLASSLRTNPAAILLRWQAYYLSAWSASGETHSWLREMNRMEHAWFGEPVHWTPAWAAARSLVVAQARLGDPEPLRRFLDKAISSDECQEANLNYWAYWVGEIAATHHTGEFMAAKHGDWGGSLLLHRLVNNLRPNDGALDLYVHSMSALLQQRPYVVRHDPALAKAVTGRATGLLLNGPSALSRKSAWQLEHIRSGLSVSTQ